MNIKDETQRMRDLGTIVVELNDCGFDNAVELIDRLTKERDALLAAAVALEKAEEDHANCQECDGEGVPELCEECFPLFDDARILRRLAIAKACPAARSPQGTEQ